MTIVGLNVLIASFGLSYFLFKIITSVSYSILFSAIVGVLAFVLYAVIDFLVKKENIK